MATQPITGSAIAPFPTIPPMPAVARILARFEREQLAGFIAVALELLDTLDGDADLENASDLEDDHALSPLALGFESGRGPGCEISDGRGDQAWIEWTTMRGPQKRGPSVLSGQEDDEEDDAPEDDDPGGGNVTDERHDVECEGY